MIDLKVSVTNDITRKQLIFMTIFAFHVEFQYFNDTQIVAIKGDTISDSDLAQCVVTDSIVGNQNNQFCTGHKWLV